MGIATAHNLTRACRVIEPGYLLKIVMALFSMDRTDSALTDFGCSSRHVMTSAALGGKALLCHTL